MKAVNRAQKSRDGWPQIEPVVYALWMADGLGKWRIVKSCTSLEEAKAERGELDEQTKGAPDAVLMCDKQRHGEWEGKIALWFNKRTMQYTGMQTTQPIDYLRA